MNINPVIKRLSSSLMKSGKRTSSDKIIQKVAVILKDNGFSLPYNAIVDAIFTIKPSVELRSFKKSGQSVQVPAARTPHRQVGLAIRMLIQVSVKGNKPMHINLAHEILNVLRGEVSQTIIKRDSLHRMAIAQRGSMK